MSTELFSRPLEGCDAIQFQISEAADRRAALSAEVQAHVSGCAGCGLFAETFFQGSPSVLAQPITIKTQHAELRERILDAQAAPGKVVRFQAFAGPSRSAAGVWLGRIAACAAVLGFAYWLLDPRVSPVRPDHPTTAEASSMTRTVTRLEEQRRAEGEILRSAVVEGGSRVQRDASWSMSSLEL